MRSNLSARRKCCSASIWWPLDHSTTPMLAMASTLSGSISSARRYCSTARLGCPRIICKLPSFTMLGACLALTARQRLKLASLSATFPSRRYIIPRLKWESSARCFTVALVLNQCLASRMRPILTETSARLYIAL